MSDLKRNLASPLFPRTLYLSWTSGLLRSCVTMGSLTDMWVGACAATSDRMTLPMDRLHRLLEALKKKGMEVPSRRSVAGHLEKAGVAPQWEGPPARGGPSAKQYGFESLVCLACVPLADLAGRLVAARGGGEADVCTKALQKNLEFLGQELRGKVPEPSEPMPIDDWHALFLKVLSDFVGCSIPAKFAAAVCGTAVPLVFPTTPTVAYLLAGSPVAEALVGRALASRARVRSLAFFSDMVLEVPPAQTLLEGVQSDLIEALVALWGPSAADAPEEEDEEGDSGRDRKKPSRTVANMRILLAEKTKHIRFALRNRLALKNIPQAMGDAWGLVTSGCSSEIEDLLDPPAGVSHWTINRHLILLDSALDRWITQDLGDKRVSGSFGGVCIATDESRPSPGRFSGLRFQVTFVYAAIFEDRETWEMSSVPPMRVMALLGDLLSSPGKRGEDLLPILDKQLGRFGLLRADIVSGTTDGGAENEGRTGLHALLESENPSYVRRRCLPHLSWRTSDAALNCCAEQTGAYKTIAAHLADGVTWKRLRTLATTSRAAGGLELFGDGSPACHRMFSRCPGVVVSTRPQTDMEVLEYLRGREATLYALASEDCRQRGLASATKEAIEDLRDLGRNIRRGILAEVLQRCLFLMHWATRENMVAKETSWESLMSEASRAILSLELDDAVRKRLGVSTEEVAANGWSPRTWVELAVLVISGSSETTRDRLEEALEFHRFVADKASSHLTLTQDNIFGTPWLSARLLSTRTAEAQECARTLARHLAETAPGARTRFENHLFETDELWTELVDFGNARPPVPLWKGRGHFQNLFRFLAPRFLAAPDHVLDCERQHARWQWVCAAKRGLKMPGLNAFLRCTSYLEKHGGEFPPDEALAEHLEASRAQLRWDSLEANEASDVAPGWRQEMVWAERFNLRSQDHELLEGAGPQVPPEPQDTSFAARWRNYIRNILRRGSWYSFASCPEVFFYVSENKIVAGRRSRGEGEAVGRSLAVVFFEPLGAGQDIVRRVDREHHAMTPKLLTIAELMTNCGIRVPLDASKTAAENEMALEEAFASEDLRRFTGHLETSADEVHVYTLSDDVPAEAAFLEQEPFETLTKMALARLLELRGEGPRRELFPMSLQALRARAAPNPAGPPEDEAAPDAPGRGGRGRRGGKGRGRRGALFGH